MSPSCLLGSTHFHKLLVSYRAINKKSFNYNDIMKGSRPIADMDWLGEGVEDTGHLLLALHPPNILVLWDTYSGKQIWKKIYGNETALSSFDFDPFDVSRLAFKSTDCILFINDFNPSKCPVNSGKKLYVSGPITSSRPPSHSPNRNSTIEASATGMYRPWVFKREQ